MAGRSEREARRALQRLRRAVEKAARELEEVTVLIADLEGAAVTREVFKGAAQHLAAVEEFIDEQAEALEARLLEAGGLDPNALGYGGSRRKVSGGEADDGSVE